MKATIRLASCLMVVLYCSCGHGTTSSVVKDMDSLIVISPADYVEHSFKLSDFADSIAFIELAPDIPFEGGVRQICPDGLIVYNHFKEYMFLSREGKFLHSIGKIGNAPDEYRQNNRGIIYGWIDCFYDHRRDCHVIYSTIPSRRGLRLKYYDKNGEYYGSVLLNHPYPHLVPHSEHVFFSEGYYYMALFSTYLKEDIAVICFDSIGNSVLEIPNDKHRTLAASNNVMRNQYRDHHLIWGYNDTIYEVRGAQCTSSYVWDIDEAVRVKIEHDHFPDELEEHQFAPWVIHDSKEWLFIGCWNENFYCYNKSEHKLYGNKPLVNDLGHYSLDIFFDGYYYDEANDEEWLYATFYHGERLLELLEETDDLRSMAMRKVLSKKDDINPILVMVRLKK
ncbi:MAG: hypothetical protein IJ290_09335 [Bacteroidaceae bacterium]|nr:hypothetical protein [Bacteroidaceae bacterium]